MEMVCEHCQTPFSPAPSAPHQRCCGRRACILARKRQWQKNKLQTDIAYRENQAAAQKAWRERNPAYMNTYRQRSPGYVERNRAQQRLRNSCQRKGGAAVEIVKMEGLGIDQIIGPGRFWLLRATENPIVKMDGLLVDLRVISEDSPTSGP